MAIQKATVTRKYCKNALSLDRKYDAFAPFSSKFFSFSLNDRISEACFDTPKSRAKSLISC